MRTIQSLLGLWVCFVAFVTSASDFVAVVSARAMHPKGASHYQLYLYDQEGKLIRKLTSPEDAHDTDPMFSPDGDEIGFERHRGKTVEYYTIKPNGKQLRKIASRPDWHRKYATIPRFDFDSTYVYQTGDADDVLKNSNYLSPDGKMELSLMFKRPGAVDAYWGNTENPRSFWLLDKQSGKEENLDTFSGFESLQNFLLLNKSPFSYDPPLRVAFFSCHAGSTFGESFWVLDINKKKFTLISRSYSDVYPVSGEHGFITVSEERYQPLGDGRSVNCEFLYWWNSKLEKTLLSPPLSRFGGASLQFEETDQVVTIPQY